MKYPIIQTLMSNLYPNLPLPMLTSSLRTLVTVLQVRPNPNIIASYPQVVATLDYLLASSSTPVGILDLCCKLVPLLAPAKLTYISSLSEPLIMKTSTLMRQVTSTPSSNRSPSKVPLEAALFALAHIIEESQAHHLLASGQLRVSATGKSSINSEEFIESLLMLTRYHDTGVRVAVVAVLVKIQSYSNDRFQIRKLTVPLLPTLVPLLELSEKDPRIYRTLAILLRDDPEVVKMAVEATVIEKVCAIIKTADTVKWTNSELISSCLLVLVAICMRDEPYRIQVMETGVMTSVVQFMSSQDSNPISIGAFGLRKIKLAACHLLRILAHSVTLLRTGLATPEIAEGVRLLLASDPNTVIKAYEDVYGADSLSKEDREQMLEEELEVKSAVMAAVCNIIPEFSSLQEIMVKKGFLELMMEGSRSKYPPLRLNSVWALKHAIYELEKEARAKLLTELTPSYLLQLCNDEEPQVQEQAMGIIRNICCSGDMVTILAMLDGIGIDNFVQLLDDKVTVSLQNALFSPDQPHHNQIIVQVVYIISNIVMHTDKLRDMILQREDILKKLLPLFKSEVTDIRNGCAWVIINLTWVDETNNRANKEAGQLRARKLIKLGFKDRLNENRHDPSLDVRERIKTALFQLENLVTPGQSSMLIDK